jgi:hypothetical protein
MMSDDEAARAAAISAMGIRLAAAGPRTRQRLRDRQVWGDDSAARWSYPESGDAYRPREIAEAPAPWSWRDVVTAARRSTLLASAAACGFGLVLIGLNMSLQHRANSRSTATSAPSLQDLSGATVNPPDAARRVASLSDPPARSFAAILPAAPTVSAVIRADLAPRGSHVEWAALSDPPARWVSARTQAGPTAAARQRETLADLAVEPMPMPALRPRGKRPELRAARVVLARYQRPATAHAFDVTRWLANEPDPAPRVLIMSPPPHMLTHPPDRIVAQTTQPPVQHRLPPLVVASSAYPDATRYRTYYPPYGGYYGGPAQ